MFNFVSLLKYKHQMVCNSFCKRAQQSEAGLRIMCYSNPLFDVYKYFKNLKKKMNIQFSIDVFLIDDLFLFNFFQ